MQIALYTEYYSIAEQQRFVAAFTIPPFNEAPEVIVWGERIFYRAREHGESFKDSKGRIPYEEGFSYAVVTPPEPF